MFAHILDYFVFQVNSTPSSAVYPTSTPSLSNATSIPKMMRTLRALPLMTRIKLYVFIVVSSAIVVTFWWFRSVAWGIQGPVRDVWGLGWREVSFLKVSCCRISNHGFFSDLEHISLSARWQREERSYRKVAGGLGRFSVSLWVWERTLGYLVGGVSKYFLILSVCFSRLVRSLSDLFLISLLILLRVHITLAYKKPEFLLITYQCIM